MARQLAMDMPIATLSLTMFRASAGVAPKFKHKAAEGRYLLPIVREMLLRCFPRVTHHEQLRFNCLESLYNVYREMDNWQNDGSSSQTFRECVQQHLLLYTELNRSSTDDLRWRLYPKHHLAAHVHSRTNPKLEWAYRMESEIGKAVLLAKGCNVQHMHRSFLDRYVKTA